ncbi:MAG: hypothetical protein H0T62_08450 [Parachlamydiaceae bacterium]|nr:hypothetical protein [Parachlamydiaceae bacterium]
MSISTGNQPIRPDDLNMPVHTGDKKTPVISIPKPPDTSEAESLESPICPTSARNVALGIVVDSRSEAFQEPRISDIINHTEVINDGKPLVISKVMGQALLGKQVIVIAEKGLDLGLRHASLLVEKQTIPCGLQLISQGFEFTSLISQIPEYQTRDIELKSKNGELMNLELEQEKTIEGTEEFNTLDTQIKSLKNQIQDLNIKQNSLQK